MVRSHPYQFEGGVRSSDNLGENHGGYVVVTNFNIHFVNNLIVS